MRSWHRCGLGVWRKCDNERKRRHV